jgi:hypothetical protein
MIRIVEIALFLAPFAMFATWRIFFPGVLLSRGMMGVIGAILIVVFGTLVWLRQEDAEPANATYVPAALEGDRITPPRADP